MGFRKSLYDVEEKGLDPKKPHNSIGNDGRLATVTSTEQPSAVLADVSEVKKEVEKPATVLTGSVIEKTVEVNNQSNLTETEQVTDVLPTTEKLNKQKNKVVKKKTGNSRSSSQLKVPGKRGRSKKEN